MKIKKVLHQNTGVGEKAPGQGMKNSPVAYNFGPYIMHYFKSKKIKYFLIIKSHTHTRIKTITNLTI
jgi:hypothetical protein